MNGLHPKDFFSFFETFHPFLFKEITYVWEALSKLPNYFEQNKLGKIETKVPSTAFLMNPETISIGEDTIIEPGVYIQGPAIIGPKNIIRYGAYIRGNIITGESCIIGHGTEIKNAILFDQVHASHFNYIGDSILGMGVNLGAGAKLANVRFDQQEINISYQAEKIFTQLYKLGCVLGDKVRIGCNCVTNPGTLIYPQTFCFPCSSIRGVIFPNLLPENFS